MLHSLTLYGTKVYTDIKFPLDIPTASISRATIKLLQKNYSFQDMHITCGFRLYRAHGRKVYLYTDRVFENISQKGQPWCYEVENVCRFFWIGGEETIYYQFLEDKDVHLLSFWFIHLMLPFFLVLEEKYEMFHGGSVMIDGKAVMFCAPSMGGKSTMTDYFIQQGHALISDDKIPLWIENDQFMLTGSHPYHRPYRKFEELGYHVSHFMNDAVPLNALYILEKGSENSPVIIEELHGFLKFQKILPHYLFSFASQQKKRMHYLANLAEHTKVFKVQRPWNLQKLDEVYQSIVKHVSSLNSQ